MKQEKTSNIIAVLRVLRKSQTGYSMLGRVGKASDPFKTLICTILSARAKDSVTYPLCDALFRRYRNCRALSRAKQKDVEKIIKPIGFYRNKARNVIGAAKIVLKKHGGKVPKKKHELLELPGVGTKVAGCVLVYAFGISAIPVDTHVHRVSNRLGWVRTNSPEKTEKALEKIVPEKYWIDVNDVLVVHGQTVCFPRTPKCSICPARRYCRRVGVKKSS